jgi:hypothetical protein
VIAYRTSLDSSTALQFQVNKAGHEIRSADAVTDVFVLWYCIFQSTRADLPAAAAITMPLDEGLCAWLYHQPLRQHLQEQFPASIKIHRPITLAMAAVIHIQEYSMSNARDSQ